MFDFVESTHASSFDILDSKKTFTILISQFNSLANAMDSKASITDSGNYTERERDYNLGLQLYAMNQSEHENTK